MPRTLIVTNDFPPRTGGIETFVLAMATRMPPESVVVHTCRQRGDAAFDATLPFEVVRDPSPLMLPTPALTRRRAEIARSRGGGPAAGARSRPRTGTRCGGPRCRAPGR